MTYTQEQVEAIVRAALAGVEAAPAAPVKKPRKAADPAYANKAARKAERDRLKAMLGFEPEDLAGYTIKQLREMVTRP